jgi:hypothetical protein
MTAIAPRRPSSSQLGAYEVPTTSAASWKVRPATSARELHPDNSLIDTLYIPTDPQSHGTADRFDRAHCNHDDCDGLDAQRDVVSGKMQ